MAIGNSKKYLSYIKNVFKEFSAAKSFQRHVRNCRVVDVDEGRVKVEMEVQEEHTNPFGTLHGGLTATLVDIVTTTALMATERGKGGVSVNLSVNYIAPVKIGDTILIDAYVTRNGNNLGFTAADIYRKSDNAKIITALHIKSFSNKKPIDAAKL